MNRFSFGFVYVLQNEAMPGIVKIGQTSRLSEDRASDLFGTSVPFPFEVVFRALTSNQKALEREVHEQLKELRVTANREFFRVSAEVAVATIFNARLKIDGIETWASKSPFLLQEGERILLSMRAGQVFTLFGYPRIDSSCADIIDAWQAHSDTDTLELYFTEKSEFTSAFSNDEPFSTEDVVPFLDRRASVNNDTVIGRERLVPGDRLLWMYDSGNGSFSSVLFEAHSHCQIIARTREPQFINGSPLLLNDLTVKASSAMIKAGQEIFSLPVPRVWAPRYPEDQDGWTEVAMQKAIAEHWLPQLGERRTGKK